MRRVLTSNGSGHAAHTETLEARRLLTTSWAYTLYDIPDTGYQVPEGVSATHDSTAGSGDILAYFYVSPFAHEYASTYSVTLDDLPEHTMMKAVVSIADYTSQSGSDEDTFVFSFAGASGGWTRTENDITDFGDAAINTWKAHSDDSVTLTIGAEDFDWGDGAQLELSLIHI